MIATVIGEMLGIPGNGRKVSFRIPHVFEFRDGLVRRARVVRPNEQHLGDRPPAHPEITAIRTLAIASNSWIQQVAHAISPRNSPPHPPDPISDWEASHEMSGQGGYFVPCLRGQRPKTTKAAPKDGFRI